MSVAVRILVDVSRWAMKGAAHTLPGTASAPSILCTLIWGTFLAKGNRSRTMNVAGIVLVEVSLNTVIGVALTSFCAAMFIIFKVACPTLAPCFSRHGNSDLVGWAYMLLATCFGLAAYAGISTVTFKKFAPDDRGIQSLDFTFRAYIH
jgi:hypothetical protein